MEIYRIDDNSPKWMITAYNYVRTDAFCFGQNIPIEKEFSGDDPNEEIRAVLIIDEHKPIAGLRITYPEDGVAKIGRVCVIRERQKSGIGSIMMDDAEKWIASNGVYHIVISSQDRALGFYTKLGYTQNDNIDPHIYENHQPAEHERPINLGFSCVMVEKYLVKRRI